MVSNSMLGSKLKPGEKSTFRMFTFLVKAKKAMTITLQMCILPCDLSSQCLHGGVQLHGSVDFFLL